MIGIIILAIIAVGWFKTVDRLDTALWWYLLLVLVGGLLAFAMELLHLI